jgi:hypothetical protein
MQFVRCIMDQVTGYDRVAAAQRQDVANRNVAEAQEARQQALEAIEKLGLRRPGQLRETE